MSNALDLRNWRLPKLSRTSAIIGVLAVVLASVAGYFGWQLYRDLTTKTAIAYFEQANALYPGDRVEILGVPVGAIDAIEPASGKHSGTMKVTFHYDSKYKVPKHGQAVILNPTLVASRNIQLDPYTGGPVLEDNGVIERTDVPVEWDGLRTELTKIITELGPDPEKPNDRGPFGDVIHSFAYGLAGKGNQINTTLDSLATSLTALGEGRSDFFAVVRSLALFVNALRQSDHQLVALNNDLAQLTGSFTNSDRELSKAIEQIDQLLPTLRNFLDRNGDVITHDVNKLYEVSTTLVQPEPLDGIETVLHVLPALQANLNGIYHPANGGLAQLPAIGEFANPMSFLCSAIQAGSRLGYQESAELCAQYLAPILDAIKFNYPPFALNPFYTAATLPKQVSYTEERLRPPPGYKDTTVPGIFARDTPFGHGNQEPGWVVAPGMQGTRVGDLTARMLTPESLAELMGGPDIAVPTPGQTMAGPPNAYDEHHPPPPPGFAPPGPPVPAPEVRPGPPPPSLVIPGTGPAGSPLAAEAPGTPGGQP